MKNFDVIIVGGSYAGMSAALPLARARRKVLVLDSGLRRNRFAHLSHGFLGQDGRDPAAIAAEARTQLLKYKTVEWIEDEAISSESIQDGFSVRTKTGSLYQGSRLIIASGVIDELPDIPGVQERWGKHIFHCPYCHGYELNNGRIGVLASGAFTFHQAMLVPDWGSSTLFTNGTDLISEEQHSLLSARGVSFENSLVQEITGDIDVRLADGRTVALDGLFIGTRTRISSPLPAQLNCELAEGPTGFYIQTDERKVTSVPGVFACGDAARPSASVAISVGDGMIAGVSAHQSLIFT